MNITILNGNPDDNNHTFDQYLLALSNRLLAEGHEVRMMALRDLVIRACTGCYACWVHTGGHCVSQDDTFIIRQAVSASDLTLLASPLLMGFPSALLKRTADKLTLLDQPAADKGDGQARPALRPRPAIGLLFEAAPYTNAEDLQLAVRLLNRVLLNCDQDIYLTSDPVENIAVRIQKLPAARGQVNSLPGGAHDDARQELYNPRAGKATPAPNTRPGEAMRQATSAALKVCVRL